MYPFKRRNPLGFCKGNTEFLLIVRQRPGVLLQRVARIGKNNLAYSLLLRETVLSGCDSFAYSLSASAGEILHLHKNNGLRPHHRAQPFLRSLRLENPSDRLWVEERMGWKVVVEIRKLVVVEVEMWIVWKTSFCRAMQGKTAGKEMWRTGVGRPQNRRVFHGGRVKTPSRGASPVDYILTGRDKILSKRQSHIEMNKYTLYTDACSSIQEK